MSKTPERGRCGALHKDSLTNPPSPMYCELEPHETGEHKAHTDTGDVYWGKHRG
jgi:hypothetical protein